METITDPATRQPLPAATFLECPADTPDEPHGCGHAFKVLDHEPHELVTCPECELEFDPEAEEARREKERQRVAVVAGLHELADFLADHDAVPLPFISIHSGYLLPPAANQLVAQWVDGLDSIDIEPGITEQSRKLVRWFAGLRVTLDVGREHVGQVRTVDQPVEVFEPLTPAEFRERARAGIAQARQSLQDGLAAEQAGAR